MGWAPILGLFRVTCSLVFGVIETGILQVIATRHTPASLLSEPIEYPKSPPKQNRSFICTERRRDFKIPGTISFAS